MGGLKFDTNWLCQYPFRIKTATFITVGRKNAQFKDAARIRNLNLKTYITMNPERIFKGIRNLIYLLVAVFILQASTSFAQVPDASFTVNQQSGCIPLSVQFTNTSVNAVSYFWDFGNGNFSTAQNPTNIYLNTGSYNVKLIATSSSGQSDSVVHSGFIQVQQQPQVAFTASGTLFCLESNQIQFTNQSSGYDSCLWDFGDGITSGSVNPFHQYTAPGTYTVTLIAYNTSLGCNASLSKNAYITILSNPAASFQANITSTCNVSQPFLFTAQASSATSYLWQFGDGTTSTQPSPSHIYSNAGIYSVTLITSNQLGCTDTVTVVDYIEVKSNPVPVIASTSPLQKCTPIYASFSTTTPNITSWSWDFGDTTTSQLYNPYHAYNYAGNYILELEVIYANGCTNSDTVHVQSYPKPTAYYLINNNQGCAPLTPAFVNLSTGTNNTYAWTFGDGSTGNGFQPVHTYTTPGTFYTTLNIVNNFGCTAQASSFLPIIVSEANATFTADDLAGCAPHTVNFAHPGGGVYTYNWNFGDGNSSTQQSPSHVYASNGTYTVVLTITDVTGCTDTYTLPNNIQVNSGVNNFNPAAPVTACAPFTINLNDNSPATSGWLWSFGDGETATVQNPVYTYTDPGTYIVTLQTQSSGSSCSQSISPYATYIINGGSAGFDVTQTLCPPFTATFNDQSVNAVSWLWDFGDGTTSTQQNPVHVYTTPGSYNVSLTITTAQGCTYTEYHNYAVTFLPLVANATATSPDTTLPINATFNANSSGATMWLWDFGDGGTSTLMNPVHQYTVPGPYNITLTISNPECTFTYVYTGVTIGSGTVLPGGGGDSLHVPDPVYSCIPYQMNFTNPALNTVAWLWDFGDGDTSTIENPVHIYTDPGTYTVSLITWDAFGNTDTIVQPAPIYLTGSSADFQLSYTNNCLGSTLTIQNTSVNAVSWLWNFGDGITSTLENPVHNYTTTGVNYIVSLTVTDSLGCTDFMSRSYYAAIGASVNASTRRACANDTVHFTSGYLNFPNYSWNFGDGTTSALANPSHVYADSGSYQVSLTVTDSLGCTYTWNVPYLVNIRKPVSDFTFTTTTNGCGSTILNFSNNSTGATSWQWNFGDGTASSQQNPSHTYSLPGTHHVTLISNADGCSDVHTVQNAVFVPFLQANFNYTQSSECLPVQAVFADSSSDAVSWLWDFGDGATSTLQNPVHTYNHKPAGVITLTVTDVNGCMRTVSKPNINAMFLAFAVSDSVGCSPFTFNVTDSSSNVSSLQWNFGDGTVLNGNTLSHTYSANGIYPVTLTATSPSGCTQVINPVAHVQVTGPQAQFSLNSVVSCAPTVVNFNDNSSGAIQWNWNFGDGNQSIINDPVHIYNEPGIYDVTLTVTDGSGCSDTLIRPALVHITGSVASFTAATPTGCGPWQVQFQDSSISAFNWIWNFGDGTSSTQQNPVHSYNQPGNYVVTLMTQDTTGCQSFYTSPVPFNLQPNAVGSFVMSDTTGCLPLSITFNNNSVNSTSYQWDFGDGTGSMAPTPTHVYNNPGTYYVTLIAQNGTGCTDSVVTTIPVVAAATPQPAFYVSNNIGCPPLPVTFHNQSLMTDSATQFTWSLGNGLSTSNSEPTYVYHVPGTYSVTLTAVNGGVCSASATLSGIVQVNVGTPPPVVELKSASVIDGSSVELTWGNLAIQNLEAYKVYRFNRVLSAFDLIYTDSNPGNTSLNATSTFVDTMLNTVSETYTYIVQAMNECMAEPELSLHTPHTTINLNTAIVDNAVHLDWNLYDGCSVSKYQIFRQDHQTGSFNLIAEVGEKTFSFIDSTVYCGMLAAYRIKATDLCNEGFEAWSDVEAIDAPGILANQKVDIIRSTVNDDSYVFTEWAPPVLAPQLVTNFELYRSYDMQNWTLLTTLPPSETNYSDFNTQVKSQNYYYKIKVNNLCNLETTEGDPGSSILLTGAIDDENRTHLKWTPYKDWETGVDYYVIERVDLNGNWQPIQVVDGSVNDYIDR